MECAFQNLTLAKQNTEIDEEARDGPEKKPDPPYVHVVNRIPPEEDMITVPF